MPILGLRQAGEEFGTWTVVILNGLCKPAVASLKAQGAYLPLGNTRRLCRP
jgi:hypothetical protein